MTNQHQTSDCLYCHIRKCLDETEPADKVESSFRIRNAFHRGELHRYVDCNPPGAIVAGIPRVLELLDPRDLPRRSLSTPEGQIAMLHAIAHIEFSAINLAWDAAFRFRDMPDEYYHDWAGVAADEARHFTLLQERLRMLGSDYGQLPAHKGLWDMAVRTAGDVLARMALVPRAMEARGLDVTPGITRRFQQIGDNESVDILNVIVREEVGHVRIGTRWFNSLCADRGLQPEPTYFALLDEFLDGDIRPPLDLKARGRAGFTDEELDELEKRCEKRTVQ